VHDWGYINMKKNGSLHLVFKPKTSLTCSNFSPFILQQRSKVDLRFKPDVTKKYPLTSDIFPAGNGVYDEFRPVKRVTPEIKKEIFEKRNTSRRTRRLSFMEEGV